jgi:hypothetical protein
VPACIHLIEDLLVLERVHARPKAVIVVRDDLSALDEALEGLLQQFFPIFDVVEDASPEGKVAPVDAQIRSVDVRDRRDEPVTLCN